MLSSEHGFVNAPSDIKYQTKAPGGDQLMPHDIGAEEALLGALLIDPPQMVEVGYLQRGDFFITRNGHLFEVLHILFQKNGDYDYITVIDRIKSEGRLEDWGGPGNIGALMNQTPTSYGAIDYARIVYRHSISRQVVTRSTKIIQAAYRNDADRLPDEMVAKSVKYLAEIDATRNVSGGARPIGSGIADLLDEIETVQQGIMPGLYTGISDLDKAFGGFMENSSYILAGRPGMGKSGLALQLAHNLARRSKRTLLFSLEMPRKNCIRRLASQVSKVPYAAIKTGTVSEGGWTRVFQALAEIEQWPIIIDDTPRLTISAIRAIAQQEMIRARVDLVIIDHLGIAKTTIPNRPRAEQNAQIADDFMALPKQLGCPVLGLNQLSRDVEKRGGDKRPVLSDLRWAGEYEQNADGVIFLYRAEVYNEGMEFSNIAEIIIAKNREGKTGTVTVFHDKTTSRFSDLQVRRLPIEY